MYPLKKLGFSILILILIFALLVVAIAITFGAPSGFLVATTNCANDDETIGPSVIRSSFATLNRFWQFYSNGSHLICSSDDDGEVWSNAINTTIRSIIYPSGQTWSVWLEGTNSLHYAYSNGTGTGGYGGFLYYRKATLGSDGSISWVAAEQTVLTGGLENGFSYPFIAVDSSGRPWITYQNRTFDYTPMADRYYPFVITSSSSDGTWSTATGFPFQLSTTTSTTWKNGQITPLSNNKMYIIYTRNSAAANGRLYNGTTMGSAETVSSNNLYSGVRMSAVAVSNDNVHFGYLDVSYRFRHRIRNATAWGTENNVANLTSDSSPALTVDALTSNVYGFWMGTPTNNHIYYKIYNAATTSWDAAATDWLEDTNVSCNATISCYKNYGGKIIVTYLTGTVAPWNVKIGYLNVPINTLPTIGEFASPSTVYANQYFFLNATIRDDDGVAQFVNATIEINNTIILKWDSATDTFSEYSDGDNYCTLDVGHSVRTSVNSTAYKLSWKIKLYWNYTEGSIFVISTNTKVYDNQGGSGSGATTSLFTFEEDLIVNTATVDDSRVNPSQSLTFTGQLYYQGTSTPPEDTDGITAKIELSTVLKGSTTTINSTGHFIISFNAETAINQHSYNTYATTDENTVQNKTVNVIVDSLDIANLQAVEYLGNGEYRYQAQIKYAYDSSAINGAYAKVSLPSGTDIAQFTSNSTGWITIILGQTNATESGIYKIYGVNDNNYGITTPRTNQTFTLYNWTLYTVDVEDNSLTSATVELAIGNTEIWNGSPTTVRVPQDTFNITVSWLQNLEVNATENMLVNMDLTTNLTCLCYPYTVSGTIYWAASNATISSKTYSDNLLVLAFSSPTDTYLLVASCTTKPTYILNCTYDYATDFAYGYLTLTHYSNTTLSLSYAKWGINVQKTNQRLINASLSGQILTLAFTGISGQTGEVEVYCLTPPTTYQGFVTGTYSSGTKTFTGTYVFSSDKSVTLNWATAGTTDIGGGPSYKPNILVSIDVLFAPALRVGTEVNGTIRIRWSGTLNVYVYDVSFGNLTCTVIDGLPIKLVKDRDATQGEYLLNVTVIIPSYMALGEHAIPCVVKLQTETNQEFAVTGRFEFEVLPGATPISDWMTFMFLGVIGLICVAALLRRR